MNSPRKPIHVVLICLALLANKAIGLVETIQVEKPFAARQVAGTVVDTTAFPIENVLVQICDLHWSRCTATAITKTNGEFSFPSLTQKQLYYLRLSARGFNPLEVKIRTRHFGDREVKLQMSVAN